MKIVHVCLPSLPVLYPWGGAIQRRIFEISRNQARYGHNVLVYSIGNKRGVKIIDGIEIHYLTCCLSGPFKALEYQIRVVLDMKKKFHDIDVLHFHSIPEGAFLSTKMPARKFLSYDYYNFHGIKKQSFFYYLYRLLILRFDFLLPCSLYCLEESKEFWKLPSRRMHVVYNGVNLNQFHPDTDLRKKERAILGIEDKKVILYVGRVCYQKGTDILIRAVQRLNHDEERVRLLIAGPISQFGKTYKADTWQKLISDTGGIYLGPVHEKRLPAIYNACDIFVMPTREFEMFGMAAIEAQACGKPVIASDHGGLKEVVPEECGGRFPINSDLELARKINLLLDNDDYYRSASKNAVENAVNYDWDIISKRLDDLYRS